MISRSAERYLSRKRLIDTGNPGSVKHSIRFDPTTIVAMRQTTNGVQPWLTLYSSYHLP